MSDPELAIAEVGIVVTEVMEATPEVCEAMIGLVGQLSLSAPAPSTTELSEIAASPATVLLIARHGTGGAIVGTLTLVRFRIPTGMRAWIEDVVVDEVWRGKGVGESLIRAAVEAAAQAGCRTVDLTSRPSREAANRLYQREGFTQRETNVYRLSL